MSEDLPTPFILLDATIVRRNLDRMAAYAKSHRLGLRPHTKTHKSKRLARMQMERGAIGLTVAKVGEALVMAPETDDLLLAYPVFHAQRCEELAKLARDRTVRVAVDSQLAADTLATAANSTGTTIGVLVELDMGHHRTGLQTPAEAMELAQHIDRTRGLRLDGVLFYPGHVHNKSVPDLEAELRGISSRLDEVLELWKRDGLKATIVSGGSTPSGVHSHLIPQMTELRPGTYIFNDVNALHQHCATLEDCAARVICTVVSRAVPGHFMIDAGSKTLTSDRCGPMPELGHGLIVEYPKARIYKLSEEHGHVDSSACDTLPRVGQRVSVIPNHICPCVNLQDKLWWQEPGQPPMPLPVDARGKVY